MCPQNMEETNEKNNNTAIINILGDYSADSLVFTHSVPDSISKQFLINDIMSLLYNTGVIIIILMILVVVVKCFSLLQFISENSEKYIFDFLAIALIVVCVFFLLCFLIMSMVKWNFMIWFWCIMLTLICYEYVPIFYNNLENND